jgi:hypothetical protein
MMNNNSTAVFFIGRKITLNDVICTMIRAGYSIVQEGDIFSDISKLDEAEVTLPPCEVAPITTIYLPTCHSFG